MKRFITAFGLFCLFQVNANIDKAPIDLANVHNQRTKQYELNDYTKIIQYSPHRTGSTLVYNVLRYLFEDDEQMKVLGYFFRDKKKVLENKVIKTHFSWSCNKEGTCIFATVRHPVDAVVSYMRIMKIKRSGPIKTLIQKHFAYWNTLQKLKAQGKKVVLLRYEDFSENIDHIFDRIEENLDISIGEQDKNILREAFSRDNVKQHIKKFSSFNKKDITHLHGNHIDTFKEKNFDREKAAKKVIELLSDYKDELEMMGYSLDGRVEICKD